MLSASPEARAIDNRFGANLLAARTERKLSRRKLGDQVGLTDSTIMKIEIGHARTGLRRPASIGEAVILAEALGLKPGDLLRAPDDAAAEDRARRARRAKRAAVTAWAAEMRIDIPPTGEIPDDVAAAYREAMVDD